MDTHEGNVGGKRGHPPNVGNVIGGGNVDTHERATNVGMETWGNVEETWTPIEPAISHSFLICIASTFAISIPFVFQSAIEFPNHLRFYSHPLSKSEFQQGQII